MGSGKARGQRQSNHLLVTVLPDLLQGLRHPQHIRKGSAGQLSGRLPAVDVIVIDVLSVAVIPIVTGDPQGHHIDGLPLSVFKFQIRTGIHQERDLIRIQENSSIG